MKFQKFDNTDIQILTELFTHPLNFVDKEQMNTLRYFRYFFWGAGGLFLFFLLAHNRIKSNSSATLILFNHILLITLLVICTFSLIRLYFLTHFYKNYPGSLQKRFHSDPAEIIDDYFSYHNWKLPFKQIHLIRFYHGIYFIYFKNIKQMIRFIHIPYETGVLLIVKPTNISYEEFKNKFLEYTDIVYETYEEPFLIKSSKNAKVEIKLP